MSSVTIEHEPQTRMRSEDRRELILEAATAVFGEHGYEGATTDRVAKAAGVSQPYVVRMFGSKEQLFLDVLHRALDRLLAAFRAAIPGDRDTLSHRLAFAYVDLLDDRGVLLALMHSFVLGSDPVIGKAARKGFLEVYALLRHEAGIEAEEVRLFLANGMLLNTMVAIRMSDDFDSDPDARELLATLLPEKLDLVLALGRDGGSGLSLGRRS
jgi:TetR/AcrR family transcriptional regulator